MIFLDANYFLRYLVEPDTPDNVAKSNIAASLFASIEAGAIEATTSEAILAEVAYVLTSKRQYGIAVEVAAQYLAEAVQLTGLKFTPGKKRLYLRALEIWGERPRMGFVDSLTVAMVENAGYALATFDRDFDPFDDIEYWRPDTGHAGEDALPT